MENPSVSPSVNTINGDTNQSLMIDTLIALLPALAGGVMIFGWSVLLQVAVCAVSAVVAKTILTMVLKETLSAADLSSVVTGLIIGLVLPPEAPLWIGGLGSATAIIIKQLFHLLGKNLFNPTVASRIILAAAFPQIMAKWVDPCAWMNAVPDAVTSPTPLADGGEIPSYASLFLGLRGGSIGEVCIMLLLCGGIYLIIRRVINPIIPIAFMGVVAIGAFAIGKDPLVYLMSGSVVIGALFISTDSETSPATPIGKLIYGLGCGLFTVLIRQFAPFPEGVAFAILIMSALSPFIDKLAAFIPTKAKSEKTAETEEEAEADEEIEELESEAESTEEIPQEAAEEIPQGEDANGEEEPTEESTEEENEK